MSNQFHSFRLDTVNECLWFQGKRLPLTPKAFSVLVYLVERPGQLVTKNELNRREQIGQACGVSVS